MNFICKKLTFKFFKDIILISFFINFLFKKFFVFLSSIKILNSKKYFSDLIIANNKKKWKVGNVQWNNAKIMNCFLHFASNAVNCFAKTMKTPKHIIVKIKFNAQKTLAF